MQSEGKPSISCTTEYMNFKASAPSTADIYCYVLVFLYLYSVFTAPTCFFTKRHFISAANQSVNALLLLSLSPLILL